MRPEIALKIDFSSTRKSDPWYDFTHNYTLAEVNVCRNKWIAEYKRIAKEHLYLEDLCETLIDRINRAADLFISRKVNPVKSAGHTQDDSYYEWLEEVEKEENDSLNGDFPLGNDEDADFMMPFFDIDNLALIQCGLHDLVTQRGKYYPETDESVRAGILAELDGDFKEAERCYHSISMSMSILEREHACRRKKIAEGDALYAEAQEGMLTGDWKKVRECLFRAMELDNYEAMTDIGIGYAYGTFGLSQIPEDALYYLRQAASEGNVRACMELVELHDTGSFGIEGAEALKWCEKAAKAGDKKAIARLEDGFDTRPLPEILEEQVNKGNISAAWMLYEYLKNQEKQEEAEVWFSKALEAGYPEALFAEAKKHLRANRELAAQYLRRAAEKGHVRSIIGLSELELAEGDENFWQVAMKKNEPDFAVSPEQTERHLRQFAWFKLAAEAGDGDSMNTLAVAYHFGYPIERDDKEAFRLAVAAAEEKNYPAMYQAAYFLENGFGCERDIDRAVEYYTASAEQGIMSSMLRLYEIYKDGLEHIPADKEKSTRYLFMSGIGRD